MNHIINNISSFQLSNSNFIINNQKLSIYSSQSKQINTFKPKINLIQPTTFYLKHAIQTQNCFCPELKPHRNKYSQIIKTDHKYNFNHVIKV